MRVILCGYYGMGNGGDEALLASLLQMLPASVEPIVLSGNPQETRDRYQVNAVPRKSLGAVLSALRDADAFIWGGGSLIARCQQCAQSGVLRRPHATRANYGAQNNRLGSGHWAAKPAIESVANPQGLG